MKKKFFVFTLCFTLIFSSLNYKKSYADMGVISLPMIAAVSSLAVGAGIIINDNDDLYDLGRMFYDYVDRHNDLTLATVQSVFSSSVSLQPNKLVSVDSNFLDIVKEFFDYSFSRYDDYDSTFLDVSYFGGIPLSPGYLVLDRSGSVHNLGLGMSYYISGGLYPRIYFTKPGGSEVSKSLNKSGVVELCANLVGDTLSVYGYENGKYSFSLGNFDSSLLSPSFSYVPGSYTWDNLESKKENESVALPVPGDLGQLVGQGSADFWDNTDNLVGSGNISIPGVDSPSVGVDSSIDTFPGSNTDVPGVDSPSVPSDGIWSTIKDFIIGLVVPSDTFWTDTWGGLYNNFTNSFPMVDMDGFNDLVTGEKKFPNIDIDVMGVTGRVVNGDVVNSIVDWLRPIIAGFMMICLMLFNYRKIYKLIRNSEPFGGVAHGTSDFKTGISEYSHIGLVNDGFKRSEEEEFARSRYYEEMHFRNGGKL